MTDCSKIPTLALVEDAKKAMNDTVSFVSSEDDTFVSELTAENKTSMEGLNTLAENQRDQIDILAGSQRDQFETTFNSQFVYNKIGNISLYAGNSLPEVDKLNAYRYPDDSDEWYGPLQGQSFPITIPNDPSVDSGWALVTAATKDWALDTFSNTNLLSNHNFLTPSPDSITHPSATPTDYVAGTQIFSNVFVGTDIVGLTIINGRIDWVSGTLYIPRANSKELKNIAQFTASVADFDGKPRTRGVSYALVGDEYRITVGIDALTDVGGNDTPLGSVKFEQGSVATKHEVDGGSIKAIALSLNRPESEFIDSSVSSTPIPLFIHDKKNRVTYRAPSAAVGKFISSLSGGELTTTDLSVYSLNRVDITVDQTNVNSLSNAISTNAVSNSLIYSGLKDGNVNIVNIGDSITFGQGSSIAENRFVNIVANSIRSAMGNKIDSFFDTNLQDVIPFDSRFSTNGAYTLKTKTGSTLTLASSQILDITGFEAKGVELLYNATLTTATFIRIKRNGIKQKDIAITSGVGLKTTGKGLVINKDLTLSTDTITIESISGDLVIDSFVVFNTLDTEMQLTTVATSGYAYQDFTDSSTLDELDAYGKVGGREWAVFLITLGTNNLYNSGKALTPAELTDEIDALIGGLKSRNAKADFIISIPPKSNESIFPIIKTKYTYDDYVSEITNYLDSNNVTSGRLRPICTNNFDLSSLYTDGVHPNDYGHKLVAKAVTDAIGISYDESRLVYDTSFEFLTYTSDFALLSVPITAVSRDRVIYIHGIAQPVSPFTGTVVGTFTQLASRFNNHFLSVRHSSGGTKSCKIDSTGTITLDAPIGPGEWVAFDGLSFADLVF